MSESVADARHPAACEDPVYGPVVAQLKAQLPAPLDLEIVITAVADRRATLWPEERMAVAAAVDHRIAEFATGRWAARRAMGALGLPAVAIPRGASRAPIWPAGCVGAITHGPRLAAAVVAGDARLRGVGIDLETADRVTPPLFRRLFTSLERAGIDGLDALAARQRASLLFSAKEAVYKAVHPLVGRFIGFQEVAVELLDAHECAPGVPDRAPHLTGSGRFRLRYLGTHAPNRVMDAAHGAWCGFGTHVVTLVALS